MVALITGADSGIGRAVTGSPVAQAYRSLLEEFGRITIVPHGETFELTREDTRDNAPWA